MTGGAGFIGRHLVKILEERKQKVRILDLRDWPDRPIGTELIQGSILDVPTLYAAMEGVDIVYHLAADPSLWAKDPNHFMNVNYAGTCRVLEAATRCNISKIVYCSTESILKGKRKKSNQLIEESVRLQLSDMPGPYCRSKFLAEQAALSAANNGLPVVIVNPTMPVGPGDLTLTPPMKMIKEILDEKVPAYLEWQMNLVDARDAAMGHVLAAEKGRIGQRYILGGHNIAFSELLAELGRLSGVKVPNRQIPYAIAYLFAIISENYANLSGKPPRAPLTGVVLAGSPMIFDNKKAREELGWQPRPFSETLLDAIQFLKNERH